MNLLDHEVVEVLGKPYKIASHWFTPVMVVCHGSKFSTTVMCQTLEEAMAVKVGLKFLA